MVEGWIKNRWRDDGWRKSRWMDGWNVVHLCSSCKIWAGWPHKVGHSKKQGTEINIKHKNTFIKSSTLTCHKSPMDNKTQHVETPELISWRYTEGMDSCQACRSRGSRATAFSVERKDWWGHQLNCEDDSCHNPMVMSGGDKHNTFQGTWPSLSNAKARS